MSAGGIVSGAENQSIDRIYAYLWLGNPSVTFGDSIPGRCRSPLWRQTGHWPVCLTRRAFAQGSLLAVNTFTVNPPTFRDEPKKTGACGKRRDGRYSEGGEGKKMKPIVREAHR